jgi:hypothetical protein
MCRQEVLETNERSGPVRQALFVFSHLLTPWGACLRRMAGISPRLRTGPTASRRASFRKRHRRGRVGIERNLVVTVRDRLDPKHYLHDLTATDKRQPTVNANGPLRPDRALQQHDAGARSDA